MKRELKLKYIGRDSWERPVYDCDGRLYVDVIPRAKYKPEICTKHDNAFDGEPDTPIDESVTVDFSPYRDVWW